MTLIAGLMLASSLQLGDIVADPARPLASAAVLAIRDGKVVYRAHAGCKRFEGTACVPAAQADLYRVASVSKLVVALGVMRMVDQGQLDLDRDIGSYLGYKLHRPVTLRMLLTHTGGLTDAAGYRLAPEGDIRSMLAEAGPQWDELHPPGSYFRYANLNFGAIASVMERASGERFDRLMHKLVMAPLGLAGGFNTAQFSPAERAALATLYRRPRPDGPWVAQIDAPGQAREVAPDGYVLGRNGTLYSPQGGLRISADGLGVIAQMVLDDGRAKGRAFLSPAAVAELQRVHWRSNGSNGDDAKGLFKAWGLGIQLFGSDGVMRGAGHLGDAWGLLSGFAFDPSRKTAVIYLIGGMAFDPYAYPGHASALTAIEERLLAHAYSFVQP